MTLGVLLTLVIPLALSAQANATRRVSGTIKDSNGLPLQFATITPAGSKPVTVDDAGRFTVSLPAVATTITARAIGHRPQEVSVAANVSTIDIALETIPLTLGEIVISGAANDATQHATTATAAVTSSQLTVAPAQSIEQALQGKILGASVNMNSGAPGGGGQIQIRGMSSVLGNGEPLVVIDGVISSNDAFSAGASTVTRGGPSPSRSCSSTIPTSRHGS